jgi:hypothetical protein
MKVKKALKRLNKVEGLLSEVIDQCRRVLVVCWDCSIQPNVGHSRPKEVVHARVAAKKPPARAPESAGGGLSAEGRKRISLAAKKRWAMAKRKGMNAATGRPLSKTA